jgi:hypothetical protein
MTEHPRKSGMAKNKNTMEKRRKELKRMQKAQEKRERRMVRKSSSVDPETPDESTAVQEPEQTNDPSATNPEM